MDLLAAMQVYVRVVELKGLSAAARDLGMSQPAVSERVDRLEERLGARLVERTTRSLRVTDAGALFYEHAKRTLEEASQAEAAVRSLRGEISGSMRVAAPHGFGEVLLTPLLNEFQRAHPRLLIDMVLNDRFVDPVTEGVDLSIRIGPVGVGEFVARKLGVMRRALLASPEYVRAHGQPRTPEELAQHPYLLYSRMSTGALVPMRGPQGLVQAPTRPVFTADHWRPLQSSLLAGVGVATVQVALVQHDLDAGRLVRLMPDYECVPQEVHAIYPASRHIPERTRRFVALLIERLGPRLA